MLLLLGKKTTLIVGCLYQEKRQRLFGVIYIKRMGNTWIPLSQRLVTSVAYYHEQATLEKCCNEQCCLFLQKALPQRKGNGSLGHPPESVSLGAKAWPLIKGNGFHIFRQRFISVALDLKCCSVLSQREVQTIRNTQVIPEHYIVVLIVNNIMAFQIKI